MSKNERNLENEDNDPFDDSVDRSRHNYSQTPTQFDVDPLLGINSLSIFHTTIKNRHKSVPRLTTIASHSDRDTLWPGTADLVLSRGSHMDSVLGVFQEENLG